MTKMFVRKTMTIGSRIATVIVVLILLVIGVLKLAERSEEPLRLGVQDFLSKLTGGQAEITEMPKSELFPEIIFHVKGVVVREQEKKDKSLITAEDGYLAIDFWRSFLGFSRFNAFEIRNLKISSGYLFPAKMDLVFAGISDPPPHEISPVLLLEGAYNKLPLMVTIEMRRHGQEKPKYDFGKVVPMTFKLGTLEASAYMERKFDSVGFEKITAVRGPHKAIFAMTEIKNDPLLMKANGTLDDVPFSAELTKQDKIKTLVITTSEPEKITKFMDLVRHDFGIDKDSKTFIINILPEKADIKESVKE